MAPGQTRTATPNTDESDLASDGRIPNSDESMTLNIVEDGPLGGKEDETEVGTIISNADDFPDGGLSAWSVVLGVSPLLIPVCRSLLIRLGHVVYLCHLRDVGHTTDFIPNHRFTPNHSRRFGLVNAWGVSAFRTLSPVDVMANRRNRYFNRTTNEFSYQRPQRQRCERRIFYLRPSI